MQSYYFYKEDWTNWWFVDIPEWEGPKSALQMVMGADDMLDLMSQGDDRFLVTFSTEETEGFELLEFQHETPEWEQGAQYILKTFMGFEYDLQVWLCDVTKFVFGEFPRKIWIKRN